MPQLLDTTPDGMWGDDGLALGDIGTIGHGSGTGSGQGFGSGHGRLSGSGAGGGGVGSSSLLSVGNLADLAQATGVEAGALFTYTVGTPVSLGAHSSSLVPFLEQPVTLETVTWVDGAGSTPRSSVRFVNATGQTLPAGTIAFFAAGGFSGETTLDRLKPGERRFLSFGADLDVELTEKKTKTRETPKRLTFDHDVLEEHFLRTSDLTWELENRSGAARAVYVVLHLDRNAKVEGADELDFDTASNRPVAIFKVDAKKRTSRTFTAVEGLSRRTSFSALSAERLTKLAAESELPAPDRAIATEAAARQGELEASHKEVEATRGEISAIEKDLERLREHLRAMGGEKGNVGPQNPFVKRILEKEDALAVHRKKLARGAGKGREEARRSGAGGAREAEGLVATARPTQPKTRLESVPAQRPLPGSSKLARQVPDSFRAAVLPVHPHTPRDSGARGRWMGGTEGRKRGRAACVEREVDLA